MSPDDLKGRYNVLLSSREAYKVFQGELHAAFPHAPEHPQDLYAIKQLLQEVYDLFLKHDYAGKYAVRLLHAHFKLEPGEKMVLERKPADIKEGDIDTVQRDIDTVQRDIDTVPCDISPGHCNISSVLRDFDIMKPTNEGLDNVTEAFWNSDGKVLEHRRYTVTDKEEPPSPPSSAFFEAFDACMKRLQITCLGVCYSMDEDRLHAWHHDVVFLEKSCFRDSSGVLRKHETRPIHLPNIGNDVEWLPTTWTLHRPPPDDARVARFLSKPRKKNDVLKFSGCVYVCCEDKEEVTPPPETP